MDLVFICKDGDFGSLLTNFIDAITAKRSGMDVGIIVTQEALAAIATGEMRPRPTLDDYTNQDVFRNLGLPLDRDGLLTAARDAGVPIIACGGWTAALGLEEKLPDGVNVGEIVSTILEAKKVIGGF